MVFFEIIQQPPTLTNHYEQPPAGMKILGMNFQVFCEFPDTFRQESYLNFRRSVVFLVDLVILDYFPFFIFR